MKRTISLRAALALLAIFIMASVGSGFALGYTARGVSSHAATQHCPIISLKQVQIIMNHPDLIELTNGNVCTFNAGPWAIFGIQLQNDKGGKLYEQNYSAANSGTVKVPGTERAFWGTSKASIFFWKNGKFGALIGGSYITSKQFVSLASAAALKI